MIQTKPVVGYEGLYIVDSIGNIISLPKFQGRYFHNKYVILTTKLTTCGYHSVALTKDGVTKHHFVHRLVATAFLNNDECLPEVNHKNGVKVDNRLCNLEWCSKSYNMKHALEHNLSGTLDSCLSKLAKMNYYTEYVKIILERDGQRLEFDSAKAAASFLGTHRDNVTRAICKHGRVKGWLAFGSKRANGES